MNDNLRIRNEMIRFFSEKDYNTEDVLCAIISLIPLIIVTSIEEEQHIKALNKTLESIRSMYKCFKKERDSGGIKLYD